MNIKPQHPLCQMGFYMLPEDRVREDAIIAGEHAKRTHVKGLKRNAGGHTAVLINRLRVAIEARAPPSIKSTNKITQINNLI